MKINIDMDNTLLDFKSPYDRARSLHPEQPYPQSQYGFFANLELLPLADLAYKYFTQWRDHEVYFLSAPSVHNPMCYTEKRISIEKHFGFDACENLILACDKSLIRGDMLIDDRVDSNKQNEFQGELVHFGSDKFPDWAQVLLWFDEKYHDGEYVKRIQSAVHRKYNHLVWQKSVLDARIKEQKERLGIEG